jgi:hypothetical protein
MARRKSSSKSKASTTSRQEGVIMWVLSLLLMGGIVVLILWLAGVFDRNGEGGTTMEAFGTTMGAAEDVDIIEEIKKSSNAGLIAGLTVGGLFLLVMGFLLIKYGYVIAPVKIKAAEGAGRFKRGVRRARNVFRKENKSLKEERDKLDTGRTDGGEVDIDEPVGKA